jgi:hypothetical protein
VLVLYLTDMWAIPRFPLQTVDDGVEGLTHLIVGARETDGHGSEVAAVARRREEGKNE